MYQNYQPPQEKPAKNVWTFNWLMDTIECDGVMKAAIKVPLSASMYQNEALINYIIKCLNAFEVHQAELADIRKLLNCDDNESTYDEVAHFVSIVKSMRKHQIDFFANGNSVDKQTRGEMISASKKYERLVDGMIAEKPNEVLKIQQNDLFENNGGC